MDTEINTKIQLNQKEQELFEFLLNFIKTKNLTVTIRAAGGWVRDKHLKVILDRSDKYIYQNQILGKESDDIDLALDTISGRQFIEELITYLKEIGKSDLISGVGIIKSNPDLLKHLEVATFKLFGYDIDLVNLRCDDYADTGQEDMHKFYLLQTNEMIIQ